MSFFSPKINQEQRALEISLRNEALRQREAAKEIYHHPSLLYEGAKEEVNNLYHHPLSTLWDMVTEPPANLEKSTVTQALADGNKPLSQKQIDEYGAQHLNGVSGIAAPLIGGAVGRISEDALAKLLLLRKGKDIGAHRVLKQYGEQKYGHILDRVSAKDDAQPPFGTGDYNPRSTGYRFPENGEAHEKPYVKLNRALLLGEMQHPHTGKILPILLREGYQDTANSFGDGLGNRHIEFGHGNDIRKKYYNNAPEHAQDVIGNATHLYYEPNKNSFLFVKKKDGISDKKNLHPTVAVRLDKDDGDHFTTITGYNERWNRIDDGKNQFIRDNADKSGIVRPTASQPAYDTTLTTKIKNEAGLPSGGDSILKNRASSYPTTGNEAQNPSQVKHVFTGLGAFSAGDLANAHQKYQEFQNMYGGHP